MRTKKGTCISLTTSNDLGTMGKVFSDLAGAGVYVGALSAWSEGDKGEFRLIVEDSARAAELLTEAGYAPRIEEVVIVMTENKAGTAWAIGKKLGDAGVNITKAFATSGSGDSDMLILFTEDNDKAISVLS